MDSRFHGNDKHLKITSGTFKTDDYVGHLNADAGKAPTQLYIKIPIFSLPIADVSRDLGLGLMRTGHSTPLQNH